MTDGPRTARAGTNIALVKYWGKRDRALNLPATGSLSLTLADLETTTSVVFSPTKGPDRVFEGNSPAGTKFSQRASAFVDLVRTRAGLSASAEIRTANTFPTGSGLASSASGFAALALAATSAAGLQLTPPELSALARRGSGSAARSIFGGFVEMAVGTRPDGSDAIAHQILPPQAWPLRLVVAVTSEAAKSLGSTEAMERTAATSPYYAAWITSVDRDLAEARVAVATEDLERLGPIIERSALRMHASALAAEPGIQYWNAATISAIEAVRELRRTGTLVFFTIDAGPHVKALCSAADAPAVAAVLARVPGVLRTTIAAPGPDATLV